MEQSTLNLFLALSSVFAMSGVSISVIFTIATFVRAGRTHSLINSRMTELLELQARTSRAEGFTAGQAAPAQTLDTAAPTHDPTTGHT